MDLISLIWIKLSRAPVCTTALGVTGLPGTPGARSCWAPVEVEPPAGVPARTGSHMSNQTGQSRRARGALAALPFVALGQRLRGI
jgi:hypothetical protein